MVLINKIYADECSCGECCTEMEEVSTEIEWDSDTVILTVVDRCTDCGELRSEPYYIAYSRDDSYV